MMAKWRMTKGPVTFRTVYMCCQFLLPTSHFPHLLHLSSIVREQPSILIAFPVSLLESILPLRRIRPDPSPAITGRCRHSGPDVCSKQESTELQAYKPPVPTAFKSHVLCIDLHAHPAAHHSVINMVFARSISRFSRPASTLLCARATPLAHRSSLGRLRTLTATSRRQVRCALPIPSRRD